MNPDLLSEGNQRERKIKEHSKEQSGMRKRPVKENMVLQKRKLNDDWGYLQSFKLLLNTTEQDQIWMQFFSTKTYLFEGKMWLNWFDMNVMRYMIFYK